MCLLCVSGHSERFLKPVKKLGLGWPLRRLENVKNDDFAPFRKNFIVTMVRDKENAFKHEIWRILSFRKLTWNFHIYIAQNMAGLS